MSYFEEIRSLSSNTQKEISECVDIKIKKAARKGLYCVKIIPKNITPWDIDFLTTNGFLLDVQEEYCEINWRKYP